MFLRPQTGVLKKRLSDLPSSWSVFGRKVHRPSTARAKAAPFLSTFKELKPGDFVVHTDYGVGEYQGLTHISIDGFETDFLSLPNADDEA